MGNQPALTMNREILKFAWPILFTNLSLFAGMLLNRIWAGNFLDDIAIATISLSNNILYVVTSVIIGMLSAISSVVAIEFGAKRFHNLSKIFYLSLILIALTAFSIGGGLALCIRQCLTILDTPQNILISVKVYLQISCCGFPFLFVQMLISYIFRSLSNHKAANMAIYITIVVNAILDPILMLGLLGIPHMGSTGAALASVIAQLFACCYSLYQVFIIKTEPELINGKFNFDREIFHGIRSRAINNIIQIVLINAGLILTQFFVNQFGSTPVAIFGALLIILDGILYYAWAVSLAVSILASQYFGARDLVSVRKCLISGAKIIIIPAVILSIVSLLASNELFKIFFNENLFSVLHQFKEANQIFVLSYIFLSLSALFNAFLNSLGYNRAVTLITVLGTFILRIPGLIFFTQLLGFNGIWVTLTLTYVISGIAVIIYGLYVIHSKHPIVL